MLTISNLVPIQTPVIPQVASSIPENSGALFASILKSSENAEHETVNQVSPQALPAGKLPWQSLLKVSAAGQPFVSRPKVSPAEQNDSAPQTSGPTTVSPKPAITQVIADASVNVPKNSETVKQPQPASVQSSALLMTQPPSSPVAQTPSGPTPAVKPKDSAGESSAPAAASNSIKKNSKDKDAKTEEPSKLTASPTLPIVVPPPPASVPVSDIRPFTLAFPKEQKAVGSKEEVTPKAAASAVQSDLSVSGIDPAPHQETVNQSAFKNAAVRPSPKSPIAFSVALPKTQPVSSSTAPAKATVPAVSAGAPAASEASSNKKNSSGSEQRHTDSSKPEQASPAAPASKTGDPAAVLKTPSSSPATNVAAAVPNTGADRQQHIQSSYSNSALLKSSDASPATQAASVSEPAKQAVASRPQTIDLKIDSGDKGEVAVRVSQRAGDVQVTVRTADGDLAQSLKQHLPELSDRLVQNGVHGEIWHPGTAQFSNANSNSSESWNGTESDSQQQPQRESNQSLDGGADQEHSKRSTAWLDELYNAEKEKH